MALRCGKPFASPRLQRQKPTGVLFFRGMSTSLRCALAFSQSDEAYIPCHYRVSNLTASPHSIY